MTYKELTKRIENINEEIKFMEKTSYNITPISEYIAERFKLSTTEVIE